MAETSSAREKKDSCRANAVARQKQEPEPKSAASRKPLAQVYRVDPLRVFSWRTRSVRSWWARSSCFTLGETSADLLPKLVLTVRTFLSRAYVPEYVLPSILT